ncbi:MAG: RNA polymerase sigma factor [Pirellulales bacterium]
MADNPSPMDVAQLVAEHHESLYRYAYRLTGEIHDAEDLTQQTFLVAQAKLDQLREAEKAKSWLFTILRHCYLRSHRRQPPMPFGNLADLEAIPQNGGADDEVDPERLQAAINELPDEFKVVLVLYYFEDCPYREISEKLDLPIGTVMSRLSRAKSHLRSRLFEPGVKPPKAPRAMKVIP